MRLEFIALVYCGSGDGLGWLPPQPLLLHVHTPRRAAPGEKGSTFAALDSQCRLLSFATRSMPRLFAPLVEKVRIPGGLKLPTPNRCLLKNCPRCGVHSSEKRMVTQLAPPVRRVRRIR